MHFTDLLPLCWWPWGRGQAALSSALSFVRMLRTPQATSSGFFADRFLEESCLLYFTSRFLHS